MITQEEARTLAAARRWIRRLANGSTLDGLARDELYDLAAELDALQARLSAEPQLARVGTRDVVAIDRAAEVLSGNLGPPDVVALAWVGCMAGAVVAWLAWEWLR